MFLHSLNANYPADRLVTWVRTEAQEPGWEQDLEALPWAFLLTGTPQAAALDESDCFATRYSDDQAMVFENRCRGF